MHLWNNRILTSANMCVPLRTTLCKCWQEAERAALEAENEALKAQLAELALRIEVTAGAGGGSGATDDDPRSAAHHGDQDNMQVCTLDNECYPFSGW